MSKFSCLCADSALWDPTTSTTRGPLTSALRSCSSKYVPSHRGSWPPFPRWEPGEMQKASSRYGIFVNSTKSGCQVQMGLQTDCCVDTTLPGLPSNTGRYGPKAIATGKWRCWLAICLHQNEQFHGPHAAIQWGAHWHYDWWPTQLECLWLSAPITHVAATAMWR